VLGTLGPGGLSRALLVAHLLLLLRLLGVLHVARLVHGHLLGLGLVRRGRGGLSLGRELWRGQRRQLRLNLDRLHQGLGRQLLNRLLWFFTTAEKCALAQVCKTWRKVLYQPKFWEGVMPILHAKELYALQPSGDKEFVSLQAFALRGFQAFCLVGVSDLDICEFIDNYPLSKKGVRSVSLKRSTITDAGLEVRGRDP
jgi:hypothetical protein